MRKKIIRLAYQNPELRKDLLPLLREAAQDMIPFDPSDPLHKKLDHSSFVVWGKGSRYIDVARINREFKEATLEGGIVRWRVNGRVPPEEVVLAFKHFAKGGNRINVKKSRDERDGETRRVVEQYRRQNRGRKLSPELQAERENAFGKGRKVRDVFSDPIWDL